MSVSCSACFNRAGGVEHVEGSLLGELLGPHGRCSGLALAEHENDDGVDGG